jgi:hypothetical protein
MPKAGEGSGESSSKTITIVAALIGALGLVAAAFVSGAFGGHSVGIGPGPTVTITKTILPSMPYDPSKTSTPSVNSGLTPGPTSGSIQWQGKALITVTGGLTFNTLPPSDIPDGAQLGWNPQTRQLGTYGVNVSRWNGSSAPSEAQCQSLTTSNAQFNYTFNNPKDGMAFCLDTGGNPDYEVFVQIQNIDSLGVHTYSTMWGTS